MAQDRTGTGGGDAAWAKVDEGVAQRGAPTPAPDGTVNPGAEGGSGGGFTGGDGADLPRGGDLAELTRQAREAGSEQDPPTG